MYIVHWIKYNIQLQIVCTIHYTVSYSTGIVTIRKKKINFNWKRDRLLQRMRKEEEKRESENYCLVTLWERRQRGDKDIRDRRSVRRRDLTVGDVKKEVG